MRLSRPLPLTLALAGLVAGCASAGRTAAWERPAADAEAAAEAGADTDGLVAEAEAHWASRDEKGRLEQAIATWEKVVAADPKNADALVKLARAHYFLADGFLALEEDSAAEFEVYKKGVDYGERALLLLEPGFEADMRAKRSFEEAIQKIGVDGISAAYWYCTTLGRFASKQGLSERLYYKDKLKTAMERILELDKTFFYGAADRYFGAFYSLLPGIAGKDTKKSAAHFEKSVEIAPEYLSTKVVKAQFLAKELDDEEMYRSLLEEVLAAPDGDNPDIAPENRAAKRTAQKMLAEIDQVF